MAIVRATARATVRGQKGTKGCSIYSFISARMGIKKIFDYGVLCEELIRAIVSVCPLPPHEMVPPYHRYRHSRINAVLLVKTSSHCSSSVRLGSVTFFLAFLRIQATILLPKPTPVRFQIASSLNIPWISFRVYGGVFSAMGLGFLAEAMVVA